MSLEAAFVAALRPQPRDAKPPSPQKRRSDALASRITTAVIAAVAPRSSSSDSSHELKYSTAPSSDSDLHDCDLLAPPRKQRRRCFNRESQLQLGAEVLEARAVAKSQGRERGYLRDFVEERFECRNRHDHRAAMNEARAAVRTTEKANTGGKGWTSGRGLRGSKLKAVHTFRAPRHLRKRAEGGGRKTLSPELEDELWHFFVDTVNRTKARVGTELLTTQAEIIKEDLDEEWRLRVERGEVGPSETRRAVNINPGFITRWRRFYGITWRTCNLRYKVSRNKLTSRLETFWSNVIRLRAFHAKLFGDNKLRFQGFDQKPMYFNSILSKRTLARQGQRKVGIKENVAASRERFTLMTLCRSWKSDSVPKLATLFRINAGTGARIRSRLRAKDNVLLQFAPKGSYNLDRTLDYIKWSVEPSPHPSEAVCLLLDWFAPHLCPEVDELCDDLGHPNLKLGGGLTPFVQVEDTHAHQPLSREYKRLEQADAMRDLRMRPGKLPQTSRQVVYDRSDLAWRLLDHDAFAEGFKQVGITNALDGSDDHLLTSETLEFWRELDMPRVREQLIMEVDSEVDSGGLRDWSQWRELIEDYDAHEPIIAGMEGAPVVVAGDDEDMFGRGGESGVDADNGGEVDEELAPLEEEEAEKWEPTALEPAGSADPEHAEQARAELAAETSDAKLKALHDAADLLAQVGEGGLSEMLLRRLSSVAKKKEGMPRQLAEYLRCKTLERRKLEDSLRAQSAAEEAKMKALDEQVKLAAIAAQEARANSHEERAAAREAERKARAEREEARAQVARAKEEEMHRRATFAAEFAQSCRAYFAADRGREKVTLKTAQVLAKTKPVRRGMSVPTFWADTSKTGYVPYFLPSIGAPVAATDRVFGSPAFLPLLFGDEPPKANDAVHRLRRLVASTLPGYDQLLGKRHPIHSLLNATGHNADVAYLQAAWRYSAVVPPEAFPCGLRSWPPSAPLPPGLHLPGPSAAPPPPLPGPEEPPPGFAPGASSSAGP